MPQATDLGWRKVGEGGREAEREREKSAPPPIPPKKKKSGAELSTQKSLRLEALVSLV